MEAAVEAIAELGFELCTMDDIASRAGVAHGTVYRYFANKEAVLYAVIAEKLANLAEAINEALTDPSGEGVQLAIRRFLSHVSSNRDLARIWAELSATPSRADLRLRLRAPFIDAIEGQVNKAKRSHDLDAAVDSAVAARALGAMVDNFAYVWFVLEDRPGNDAELDRLAVTLAILWNGAIGGTAAGDAGSFPQLRTATGP